MLVLTRKVQESVTVGEDHGSHRVLKVTVLAIHGQRVKLGFEVDGDVEVRRWEVWQRIRDGVDFSADQDHQIALANALGVEVPDASTLDQR